LDNYRSFESELSKESQLRLSQLSDALDIEFVKQDVRDLLSESMEGVNRVKKIVQDLKDFSHVDATELEWSDIHKGMNSTLNIVHNELKYKAEVVKEYSDLPLVKCIPSQLNQVFINILINAVHAIETRGRITIRTGRAGDGKVFVEIEDTGKGMELHVKEHIFEPFFTTKPVGQGTGLGLSLSYGIIEKHGGHIEVDSVVGSGTRFRLTLPIKGPDAPATWEI
jgi:signal transduction histidine kinase